MLYLILCVCAISLSLVGHYPREEPTIITHFNSKCSSNWQVSRFHETRYSIRNYTLIHCIIILPECIKKLLPHKTGCTITIQACAWLAWSSWKDLSCSWKWQYIGYRLFFFLISSMKVILTYLWPWYSDVCQNIIQNRRHPRPFL